MSTTLATLGLPGKSRKVKHRKLDATKWAVLEREADLRAQLTSQKCLAEMLGVTQSYVCQVLSRLVMERRGHVPRLTHGFALEKSIDQFAADLMRK